MCPDIDECAQGHCQGEDRICVNTLGSFKCHTIQCPENYFRDSQFKKYILFDFQALLNDNLIQTIS